MPSQVQDRLKIRKKGKGPDVMLGRQSFLNCGAYEGWGAGCDGGDPIDLFRFMVKIRPPRRVLLHVRPASSSFGAVPRAHATHAASLALHQPSIFVIAFCRGCTTP